MTSAAGAIFSVVPRQPAPIIGPGLAWPVPKRTFAEDPELPSRLATELAHAVRTETVVVLERLRGKGRQSAPGRDPHDQADRHRAALVAVHASAELDLLVEHCGHPEIEVGWLRTEPSRVTVTDVLTLTLRARFVPTPADLRKRHEDQLLVAGPSSRVASGDEGTDDLVSARSRGTAWFAELLDRRWPIGALRVGRPPRDLRPAALRATGRYERVGGHDWYRLETFERTAARSFVPVDAWVRLVASDGDPRSSSWVVSPRKPFLVPVAPGPGARPGDGPWYEFSARPPR